MSFLDSSDDVETLDNSSQFGLNQQKRKSISKGNLSFLSPGEEFQAWEVTKTDVVKELCIKGTKSMPRKLKFQKISMEPLEENKSP